MLDRPSTTAFADRMHCEAEARPERDRRPTADAQARASAARPAGRGDTAADPRAEDTAPAEPSDGDGPPCGGTAAGRSAFVTPMVSRQRGVCVLTSRALRTHLARRPTVLSPDEVAQLHARLLHALEAPLAA